MGKNAGGARPGKLRIRVPQRSREVTVDFLAVEAANESYRMALENKSDAIISDADTVVFARGFEAFEIGNLLKGLRSFHLLDDFLDSPKQRGVSVAATSASNDSRKAVFTRHVQAVGRFSSDS